MGNLLGNSTNTSTTTMGGGWLDPYLQNAVARADSQSQVQPPWFSGETVAPLNGIQTGAISQLANTYDSAVPFYNLAGSYYGDAGNALYDLSSPDAMAKRMNPYLSNVVGATMNSLDANNAQQAARLRGDQIIGGSYGGDRAGVGQAELARQQNIQRDQTIAGMMSAGYDKAVENALQQSSGLGRIGSAQASLGTGLQQSLIRGATAGLQAGTVSQQTQQAADNAYYQQWLKQIQAPQENLSWLSSILSGAGGRTGTTTTTSPGPSGTSQAIGAGLTGLALLGNSSVQNGLSGVGNWISSLFAEGGAIDASRMAPRPAFLSGGDVSDDESAMGDEPVMPALALSQLTPPNVAAAQGNNPYGVLPKTLTSGAPYIAAAQPDAVIKNPQAAGRAVIAQPKALPGPAATAPASPGGGLGDVAKAFTQPDASAGATPAGGGVAPQASASSDFNNMLLTTGLAMMGGQSPHAMVNIGQAGLAGLQSMQAAQKARAEQQMAAERMALDRMRVGHEDQRVKLEAQRLAQSIDDARFNRGLATDRQKLEREKFEQDSWSVVPGVSGRARPDGTIEQGTIYTKKGEDPTLPENQRFIPGITQKPGDAKPTPAQQAKAKSEQKELDDYTKSASTASKGLASLDRIVELRKHATTGPLFGRIAAGVGANQALEAETTKMWSDSARSLPGALSDKEGARLSLMVPGSSMSDDQANRVIAARRAEMMRDQQRASFMQQWSGKYGSLDGANAAWDKFTKDKPALSWDDKGDVSVNEANIENWGDYLAAGPKASMRGGSGAPAAAQKAQPPSDPLAQARDAIARGAPRDAVIKRLQSNNIDPSGL